MLALLTSCGVSAMRRGWKRFTWRARDICKQINLRISSLLWYLNRYIIRLSLVFFGTHKNRHKLNENIISAVYYSTKWCVPSSSYPDSTFNTMSSLESDSFPRFAITSFITLSNLISRFNFFLYVVVTLLMCLWGNSIICSFKFYHPMKTYIIGNCFHLSQHKVHGTKISIIWWKMLQYFFIIKEFPYNYYIMYVWVQYSFCETVVQGKNYEHCK